MDETSGSKPEKEFNYSDEVVSQGDNYTIYKRPDGTSWIEDEEGTRDLNIEPAPAEKVVANVVGVSKVTEQRNPYVSEVIQEPVSNDDSQKEETSSERIQKIIEAAKEAEDALPLVERKRRQFMYDFNRNGVGVSNSVASELRLHYMLPWATDAVCGDPNKDPLEVFPDPSQWQNPEDIVFKPNFTPEQEENFRAAMAELGPARKQDRGMDQSLLSSRRRLDERSRREFSELGKPEYKALLDAGHFADVKAELELTLGPFGLPPSMIIVGAAKEKTISEEDRALAAKQFGIQPEDVASNQYELTRQLLQHHPDFTNVNQLEKPEGFISGDKDMDLALTGAIHSIPVLILATDTYNSNRQIPPNETDESAAELSIMRQIQEVAAIRAPGELDNNVVFVTTSLHDATATIAAGEAINAYGAMTTQVMSCGIRSQARARGDENWQPPLNQLAGAAYESARLLNYSQDERSNRIYK